MALTTAPSTWRVVGLVAAFWRASSSPVHPRRQEIPASLCLQREIGDYTNHHKSLISLVPYLDLWDRDLTHTPLHTHDE